MGFPENVLTRDEKIVLRLHPHWRSVALASFVGVLLLAVALVIVRVTPDDTTGNWIQWIAVAVAVLIGVPLTIVPWLRWRTTHYVITTHRVMVRRGILNKTGKDITLSKITDVSFSQSLIDRMVGSGTLNIESAGDSPDELFRDIPHSDEVQQLINRLIDEDANKRASRIMQRAGLAEEYDAIQRAHEEPHAPSRPATHGSSAGPVPPSGERQETSGGATEPGADPS